MLMCGNDVRAVAKSVSKVATSSSGSLNFLDPISNIKDSTGGMLDLSNPVNSINSLAQIATQISSGGFIGFEDGKFGKGFSTNNALEAMGEVTGRNAARKATFEAQDALRAEKVARDKQISDEQIRKGQLDVMASQQVAAIRSSSQSQSNRALGLGASQSAAKDFLGL
jgi:hypothetical protein